MVRVLLADDQAWLRSAMRLLLEQEPDVEIIGEAAEVKSLLATAEDVLPKSCPTWIGNCLELRR